MAKQEGIRIAEYKDVEIFYVEQTNKFEFKNEDGDDFETTSLKAAKQKIGSWSAKEEKEKKQPTQAALHLNSDGYGSGYKRIDEVTVGAFGKPKASWRTDLYFWVTGKGGGRSRQELRTHSSASYFKDTPETRIALQRVLKLQTDLAEFEKSTKKEQSQILSKLKPIAPMIPKEELPVWN